MRKFVAFGLLCIMLAGLVCTTGCLGGGGGGGLAALATIGFIIAVSASGGTAAAAFAASHREQPQAAIYAGTRSRMYVARAVQKNKGATVGTPISIELDYDEASSSLKGNSSEIRLPSGTKVEYSVEIAASGTSNAPAILKQVVNGTPDAGRIDTSISPQTTAEAIVYENWASTPGNTNPTVENFKLNLDTDTSAKAEITAIAAKIDTDLVAASQSNALSTYDPTKTYSTDAASAATGIGTADLVTAGQTAVPTTIATDRSLAEPATPISLGIQHSLQTALDYVHGSKRANVVETAGTPSVIPVLGGDKALDLGGMANTLFRVAGAVAADGPEFGSHQTIDFTTTTYKITNKDSNGTLLGETLLENVTVTASGDRVTKIEMNANTVMTLVTYEKGTKIDTTKITLKSGVTGSITRNRADQTSLGIDPRFTNTWDGNTYGFVYKALATETIAFTFNSPVFSVFYQNFETTGDIYGISTGSISFTGLAGTLSNTDCIMIGAWGYQTSGGTIAYQNPSGSTDNTETMDEANVVSENLAFTNQQIAFNVSASLPNGLVLDHLTMTFPSLTKTTVGGDLEFSFTGASGEVLVNYNGSNFADFGYVKQLKVNYSNLSFDSTRSENEISNGAILNVTKTNSDNTVSKLNYKWTDGKLIFDPSDNYKFPGGNESITTDSTGKATITGSMIVRDPAGKQLSISYTTQKPTSGNITVVANMTMDQVSSTLNVSVTQPATGSQMVSGFYTVAGVEHASISGGPGGGMISWLPTSGRTGYAYYSTDLSGGSAFFAQPVAPVANRVVTQP